MSDSHFDDVCAQANAAPLRVGRKVLDDDPYHYYSK